MLTPLVSVGLPTWNRPAHLRRCVEELRAQTYSNIEIIVSDNASTDPGVAALMTELSAIDHRIRYVRQESNIGAARNFQYVLDNARGEFFIWAGDDDFRAPDLIAVLAGKLRDHPSAAMAFCDFAEVDDQGTEIESYPQHGAMLAAFASASRFGRLLRYFLDPENAGKANLTYSLFRRDQLRDLSWQRFVDRHGIWGVDMLFVFSMLRLGPAVIGEQRLYRCNVGNAKWHQPGDRKPSLYSRLIGRASHAFALCRYALGYVRLAPLPEKLVIALLWPCKAADLVFRFVIWPDVSRLAGRLRKGAFPS